MFRLRLSLFSGFSPIFPNSRVFVAEQLLVGRKAESPFVGEFDLYSAQQETGARRAVSYGAHAAVRADVIVRAAVGGRYGTGVELVVVLAEQREVPTLGGHHLPGESRDVFTCLLGDGVGARTVAR